MKLHQLKPAEGSTRPSKRKGRGAGSGMGKTAGKGHKGQLARSGGKGPYFEGGQLPLTRRLPKRGFNNIFAKKISTINLSDLNVFADGSVVDVQAVVNSGLVKKPGDGIKVLGNGEITKKLTVRLSAYSASAKEKIESAGGKAEVV
ncbi:MAG: 50S ribosomal protein L15 [Ruminococcaceae bacterium]|nr:50S ribosomal protein L15 [Oscillospiraceae bacterium]